MKTRLLFVPLLLALVASLAACGGGSPHVPADAVAVVNGTPITTADFNAWLSVALAQRKSQTGTEPRPGTPDYTTARSQTVAYLVQFEEVKQQAPKVGVSVTPKEVDKFLANVAQAHFNGSMKKLLAYYKLTMPMAQQEVTLNLLQQKIQTKVTSTAKVTDAEAKAYYTSHISQYMTPAQTTRSVEHILVKSKSLANSLEQRLKNGASFAALAKKYSKDPGSAAQGGKYTATQGREVKAYDDVAFTLKTGELSAPVDATAASNGGYWWFIIKALGPVKKSPAQTTPFSKAKSMVEQALLQQAKQTLWTQWISDLVKSYNGKVSYQAGYAPPTTTALPTTTG